MKNITEDLKLKLKTDNKNLVSRARAVIDSSPQLFISFPKSKLSPLK